MQKTNGNQQAVKAHRVVGTSTTLNRKYVKKPNEVDEVVNVQVKKNPLIRHFDVQPIANRKQAADGENERAHAHPMQTMANTIMRERRAEMAAQESAKRMTAKELKDQAIKKALSEADRISKKDEKKEKKQNGLHFSFARVMLALSCAALAVFAIVYFVNLSMPDISLKVTAMQTGFEASYPEYVPRDYSLSSITSEEGKIILSFRNQSADGAFSITEERSSWDSSALLSNYVRDNYGDDYVAVKEQGLTLYIHGSDASWVNGGIFYNLKTESGSLTKKQIKAIAVSL